MERGCIQVVYADVITRSYCDDERQEPVVGPDTFYPDYRHNGSMYLGNPQCGTCKTSNSYGQYGCPRLNRHLPIRVGRVLAGVEEAIL